MSRKLPDWLRKNTTSQTSMNSLVRMVLEAMGSFRPGVSTMDRPLNSSRFRYRITAFTRGVNLPSSPT